MNKNFKIYALLAASALAGTATMNAEYQLAGWDFSTLAPIGPGVSWENNSANFGLLKDSAKVVTSAFTQLDSVNGSNLATYQVGTKNGTTVGTNGTAFSTATDDPEAICVFNSGVNDKGIVIEFSTLGYKSISIKYSAQAGDIGGSTAANHNQWQWSTDGTNYTNVGTVDSPTTSYAERTYDFSAVTELDNKSKVYLKYVLTGSTATAATPESTLALDNIQILAANSSAVDGAVLEYFGDAVKTSGSNYTAWIGNFDASGLPWIIHEQHGFLYCVKTVDSGIWFYDWSIQGWWWSNPSIYSWVFLAQSTGDFTVDWHYYFQGTSAPRYFVRLDTVEGTFVTTP